MGRQTEPGLTLVELTIVVAVLAVLSSIAVVAVTGSSLTARGATKSSDSREVQKAVNAYRGIHPKEAWPTAAKQVGGVSIPAGSVPSVPFDPDNPASYAAIDWTATFTTVLDGRKSFVRDFLPRLPKHAEDTITVTAPDAPGQALTTPVWVLDRTGVVNVLLSDGDY